ncbi:hypothetical protein Scep_015711 [Stephania cephalantha]|uniref:Uncharacterized protein n=1 Tax=Stephania cephalantha TaxID=152367 RepID=A0AAP0P325_9MAGN
MRQSRHFTRATIIKSKPNIFWHKSSIIKHIRNLRVSSITTSTTTSSMKHLHPPRPPLIRPSLLQIK